MLIDREGDKLLMIPGPSPIHRAILDAISRPTVSHTSDAMAEVVRRCQEGLLRTAAAEDALAFIFGGSGTLAMEAALVNVVAPGERLLVATNGYFGDRFVEIGRAHGIEVDRLAAPWGTSVSPEQLSAELERRPARAVAFTHVDTSTGTAAPVAQLVKAANSGGALVIVDAVCSLGGMPIDMAALGIDIVLTGAQKALGVPPGLSLLTVSERALDQRRSMERIPAYYSDLLRWEPSMRDPRVYFSTHAVNLFYGLAEALRIIEAEGLPSRFRRHAVQAEAFRAGAIAMGFGLLTDRDCLAPTLSVLSYPDGVEDAAFRAALSARGVIAAACLGGFKGRGLRVGHMGNISNEEILWTLSALESALRDCGVDVEPGAALASAQRALQPEPAAAGA